MKLKDKLLDKTWKKCIIIFIIIFSIVLIGGFLSINYLHDVVSNSHIHTETIIIQDKLYGDSSYSDYYIIIGDNNKTYTIHNNNDGYGTDMFNNIVVGESYKIVVKEPDVTDLDQHTHILQVYNDTSRN